MKAYLDIVKQILDKGEVKPNRTGIDTIALAGTYFEHDMQEGFPLLTTKEIKYNSTFAELEFFIKGVTDKDWLRTQNDVHIWDDWCNPKTLSEYSFSGLNDDEFNITNAEKDFNNLIKDYNSLDARKLKRHKTLEENLKEKFYQKEGVWLLKDDVDENLKDNLTKFGQYIKNDLGPIYGWQWRNFGADYKNCYENRTGQGYDQLQNIIKTIKKDPNNRRMLVNAWNPNDIPKMSLPPCHYGFQVLIIDEYLNLSWNQRSVDTPLGLPFNIASYGLLLHLLAKETGYKEGKLIGNLGDTHIYVNQLEGIEEQLSREPYNLPSIKTNNFHSIFDWEYKDTEVLDYKHHPNIKFDIAV